ncbi:MAG TPA: hypothetical protein VGL72_17675 [Bryobacteraceae bacterium]|jgi:hypothetical protein
MAQQADKTENTAGKIKLPEDVVLKPALSSDDLKADTEYDPEGAEEFVAFIRALRTQGSRPVTL